MSEKLFKDVKYFIIDMDGTFYLGDKLISGSLSFIEYILGKNMDFYFFTNNSSHNALECVQKLKKIGFPVPDDKIIISSHVAIDFIKTNRKNKKVYLLGNENLRSDCLKASINLVEDDPDIVLLGFDTTLTYEKINKACNFIAGGSEFLATHPDKNCPLDKGFMTDAGSMIEMLKTSSGKSPDIIFGKPYSYTVDYILKLLNCQKDEICFIGDRLETDIAVGQNNGVKSVLVYSGVTARETYKNSKIRATADTKNLLSLCNLI